MWTVSIDKVTAADPDMARVEYHYTHDDGRSEMVTENVSEPESLRRIALDHLRELERRDAIAALVKTPPLGPLVFEAPPPDVYQVKRFELVQLKSDLELKLIDQATFDAKVAEVLAVKPTETEPAKI